MRYIWVCSTDGKHQWDGYLCEVYTLKKFERWILLEKLLEDCKDVQLKDYYYFIMTSYVSNVSIFNKAQFPARLSDIWALLQRPDYVQWQYLCEEFRIFVFSNICSCWLKKGSCSATERKLGTEINDFFLPLWTFLAAEQAENTALIWEHFKPVSLPAGKLASQQRCCLHTYSKSGTNEQNHLFKVTFLTRARSSVRSGFVLHHHLTKMCLSAYWCWACSAFQMFLLIHLLVPDLSWN